ncbi:MAG: NAD(P)-dependent oxidoreductase [Aeromicrobium erythreum]
MRVTVIGLGAMGAGMAASTLRAGIATTVWNRSPEKAEPLREQGADEAGTAGEAVADADVVLVCLFDEASVREVLESALLSSPAAAVWLQTATVGPDGSRRLHELAERHDRVLVDAPVLGTKKPAADGALTVLASGPEEALATARPVLEAIGSRTLVVGDSAGPASALKLACNSWVASLTAAAAQALTLARVQGVDPALFLEAIEGSAVDTPYAHLKGRAILADDLTPSFGVDGVLKDLALMLDAGEDVMDTSLLASVRDRFAAASAAGHGADDMAAVVVGFEPPA